MWHDVLQNTDEPCPCCGKTWMELRCGKVTGSTIAKVMAWHDKPITKTNKKTKEVTVVGPKWGDPAKNLAVEIAVVESGGSPTENNYTNSHMDRGHEQEPMARGLYEAEYFCEVTNGGFYDNERTGCSPDGMVGSVGMVEIKSVINHVHYACVERDSFDPAYKWQLLHNLRDTDREWIDYVSFCATFPPCKRLFVHRLYAKDLQKDFKLIDDRLKDFFVLVDTIKGGL